MSTSSTYIYEQERTMSTQTPQELETQDEQRETDNEEPKTSNAKRLRPDLTPLTDWEPKAIDWLWRPYVPGGMLTMLSGAAGAGKTYIALAIAAGVTAGRTCPAGHVLLLTSGDNPAHILRPRFDAFGGVVQRFHMVRGFLNGDGWSTALTDGLQPLEDSLVQIRPRLVILDPLQAFCGPQVESGMGNRTRTLHLLDGLARLAERFDCGMLLVRRLSTRHPHRAAELAPVRSELLAGCDPDNAAQRALLHLRSGCGMTGPALAYTIDSEGVFFWSGGSSLRPEAILAPEPGPVEASALFTAMEFLRSELSAGRLEGRFVRRRAKRQGISDRTLRRASDRLQVAYQKIHDEYFWSLPQPAPDKKEDTNEGKK
jgi:hypothetical protein